MLSLLIACFVALQEETSILRILEVAFERALGAPLFFGLGLGLCFCLCLRFRLGFLFSLIRTCFLFLEGFPFALFEGHLPVACLSIVSFFQSSLGRFSCLALFGDGLQSLFK